MKIKLLIGLIWLMAVAAAYAETVVVDDSCLRLNDLYADLPNIELMCNLNYGAEKKIPRERIKNELVARKIDLISHPPRTIHVVRKGVLVRSEDLLSHIQDTLTEHYPNTRVDIEKIKYRKNIFMDESGFLDVQVAKKGFGSVYATVFNGVKKYRIYVYVRAYKSVHVTTARVNRGEPFVGKAELQEKEITKVRGNIIANPDDYIAKQNVASGKIITSRLVTGKPVNFEGDHVALIYESDTIRVSTTGVLEENAYMGKNVKVRNVSSGKIIYARAKTQDRYIISVYN